MNIPVKLNSNIVDRSDVSIADTDWTQNTNYRALPKHNYLAKQLIT